MSTIDRFTEHFKALGRQCLAVEEMGEDFVVWWSPLSVEERGKVLRKAGDKPYEALVETLIMKAENEGGEKLFSLADKPKLMKCVDALVVEKIANAILNGAQNDAADLVKN